MPRDLLLPLSMVMGLTLYGLIAKWYVMPLLLSLPRARALVPLLLFHCFRFIGLAFLIPGVTSQPLDPRFANPAVLRGQVGVFGLGGHMRNFNQDLMSMRRLTRLTMAFQRSGRISKKRLLSISLITTFAGFTKACESLPQWKRK